MSIKAHLVKKSLLILFISIISVCLVTISFGAMELYANSAVTIFLDPGHGGSDPGAVHNGLRESDVNLAIALRLKGILEANGFRVIMRRTDNSGMSLDNIVNMANNSGADLFLSIHNNASLSPASSGTETYWSANGVSGSSQFASSVQSALVSAIGRPNRGVKSADFRVLRNTKMPAALVECAFLSNPEEANLLKDGAFLDRIAQGLFAGISNFAKNIQPGGGSPGAAGPPAGSDYKPQEVLVNIDDPAHGQTISGKFELKGWAVEKGGINSPEIDAVHVYDGPAAGAKNLIGIANYGSPRADVASKYGNASFTNSGFNLTIDCNRLTKGTHIIYVYAHNKHLGWSYATVRVNVLSDGSAAVDTPTQGTTEHSLPPQTGGDTTEGQYESSGTKRVLINIDKPGKGQEISGNFEIAGWAVERSAVNSTGITAIHIYNGRANGEGNLLGAATYGLPRQDVADYFGKSNLTNSGFSLTVDSSKLSNGRNKLYIYAYNQNLGWRYSTVDIVYGGSTKAPDSNPAAAPDKDTAYQSSGRPKAIINIDTPSAGGSTSGNFELSGWAIEQSATSTTGITAVHVYNGPAAGEKNMLGTAEYGISRQDVASAIGKSNFTNSGFRINIDGSRLSIGRNTLYIYAHNPSLGWRYATVQINHTGGGAPAANGSAPQQPTGGVITNATSMRGYVDVSVDQLVRIFEIRGSSKVSWARRLAPLYIKWGQLFDVRADIAWAQMAHETGFLEFSGVAKPEWNNFAGLGVVGPEGVGLRFDSEDLGVLAHFVHIAWYVYPSAVNEYCSPKYNSRYTSNHFFNGDHTVNCFNGRWAPSSIYTDKILRFANQIHGR